MAGVGVIAIVAFVGFLMLEGEDKQAVSPMTVRPSPATSLSSPVATTAASEEPEALTFDSMRSLTYRHYADLPSNPRATWDRLDPHFTARTDWNDYADFWSHISSVTVDSVMPRSSDSVIVRLTYMPLSGRPNTEDRWLSFVASAEGLRIYDSGRIGTVG